MKENLELSMFISKLFGCELRRIIPVASYKALPRVIVVNNNYITGRVINISRQSNN